MYYADEADGIHKWHADPDHADTADATDGIEISSRPLGPGLPNGLLVAMNSTPRNFLVFRWQEVAAAAKPPLRLSAVHRPSLGWHHLSP